MNYLSMRYQVNGFSQEEKGQRLSELNSVAYYVNLHTSSSVISRNDEFERINKENLIERLSEVINQYELSVLLLNSRGQLSTEVDREKALRLLDVAKKMTQLSEKELSNIYIVSSEVAKICAQNLKISKDKKQSFIDLLRQFITVELVEHCVLNKRAAITKSGEFVDYKVNRILKYLGINMNLQKLPNFTVEYSRDLININGNEYLKIEVPNNDKSSKVNRIIRK